MFNIRYTSIRSLDVSNGENVGVSLFVQGCNLRCHNCFNPETWDFNGGKKWTQEVENKFLELAARPYIKRISILGGEPLADENLDSVLNLVNEIHISCSQKSIWIYSGYTINEIFPIGIEDNAKIIENIIKRQQIIKQCDVMVDGRYIDSQRDISLKWRGSANQRVINIQETLRRNKLVLYCE